MQFPAFHIWLLSTSIYDLVLIYVCHFHHYHQGTFLSNQGLSRYSCLHLGSLHPRIFWNINDSMGRRILSKWCISGKSKFLASNFFSVESNIATKVFLHCIKFQQFFVLWLFFYLLWDALLMILDYFLRVKVQRKVLANWVLELPTILPIK